jgi:hypothetical protein
MLRAMVEDLAYQHVQNEEEPFFLSTDRLE